MKRICGDGVSIGGPQPLPWPPCHKPHHDASRYACSRKSASLHWPRADTGDTQRLRISRIIHRGTSRSEEHTSELQSLMRISYDVFCLKKKINTQTDKRSQHISIQIIDYNCT